MKIIFLDFDGVLNPNLFEIILQKMEQLSNNEIVSKDKYGPLFFNQNVSVLKNIIDKTNAKIVVSSSWKSDGLSQLKEMWVDRNLPGEIIDITPSCVEVVDNGFAEFYDQVSRGDEINLWLFKNQFNGVYVIIDDQLDILDNQITNFVKIDKMFGLTNRDGEQIIKKLNK